jgi:hypothetical protein
LRARAVPAALPIVTIKLIAGDGFLAGLPIKVFDQLADRDQHPAMATTLPAFQGDTQQTGPAPEAVQVFQALGSPAVEGTCGAIMHSRS